MDKMYDMVLIDTYQTRTGKLSSKNSHNSNYKDLKCKQIKSAVHSNIVIPMKGGIQV